jgi:hypothetical protein
MTRLKRLGYFLCAGLVLGLLLQLDKGSGAIDKFLALAWFAFMLVGSVFAVIGSWRMREKASKIPMSPVNVLPLSWQRWILDEDQLPKTPKPRP